VRSRVRSRARQWNGWRGAGLDSPPNETRCLSAPRPAIIDVSSRTGHIVEQPEDAAKAGVGSAAEGNTVSAGRTRSGEAGTLVSVVGIS
jgi:hypothetical protein